MILIIIIVSIIVIGYLTYVINDLDKADARVKEQRKKRLLLEEGIILDKPKK